jgi:hypothetical protein
VRVRRGWRAVVDPDYLEYLHREAQGERLGLPWDE